MAIRCKNRLLWQLWAVEVVVCWSNWFAKSLMVHLLNQDYNLDSICGSWLHWLRRAKTASIFGCRNCKNSVKSCNSRIYIHKCNTVYLCTNHHWRWLTLGMILFFTKCSLFHAALPKSREVDSDDDTLHVLKWKWLQVLKDDLEDVHSKTSLHTTPSTCMSGSTCTTASSSCTTAYQADNESEDLKDFVLVGISKSITKMKEMDISR